MDRNLYDKQTVIQHQHFLSSYFFSALSGNFRALSERQLPPLWSHHRAEKREPPFFAATGRSTLPAVWANMASGMANSSPPFHSIAIAQSGIRNVTKPQFTHPAVWEEITTVMSFCDISHAAGGFHISLVTTKFAPVPRMFSSTCVPVFTGETSSTPSSRAIASNTLSLGIALSGSAGIEAKRTLCRQESVYDSGGCTIKLTGGGM